MNETQEYLAAVALHHQETLKFNEIHKAFWAWKITEREYALARAEYETACVAFHEAEVKEAKMVDVSPMAFAE